MELLFENITTYDEFQREIVEGYVKNYDKLANTPGTNALSELKSLSVYNKYKVPKRDMLALIRAIEEINEIATSLFALTTLAKTSSTLAIISEILKSSSNSVNWSLPMSRSAR